MSTPDPFAHHPVLRDKILDPSRSFFRSFRPSDIDERARALGRPPDWRFTDAEIEAARHAFLAGRLDRDLWVFAYGSLMWDPAFRFAEVRRARVEGYARKFCLKDDFGGRGTPEAPGLQAALDVGAACDGLAFRIAQADIPEETGYIWRRELLAPCYTPIFLAAATDAGPVEVLAMAADHNAPPIRTDLTRAEQVRYLATGVGMLGTSLQYIENLAAHLAALGIEDREVTRLLAEARACAAAPPG